MALPEVDVRVGVGDADAYHLPGGGHQREQFGILFAEDDIVLGDAIYDIMVGLYPVDVFVLFEVHPPVVCEIPAIAIDGIVGSGVAEEYNEENKLTDDRFFQGAPCVDGQLDQEYRSEAKEDGLGCFEIEEVVEGRYCTRQVDVVIAGERTDGGGVNEQEDGGNGPCEDDPANDRGFDAGKGPNPADESDKEGDTEVHFQQLWKAAENEEFFHQFGWLVIEKMEVIFPDDEIKQGHCENDEEEARQDALGYVSLQCAIIILFYRGYRVANLKGHHDQDHEKSGGGMAKEGYAEH